MAKIYRYEQYCDLKMEVRGPYNAHTKDREKAFKLRDLATKLMKKHTDDTHPSMRIDLLVEWDFSYFCACDSLKNLKNWFKGYNTKLIKLGYNLVEVEVKRTYKTKSKKQVCFKLKDVISKKIIA